MNDDYNDESLEQDIDQASQSNVSVSFNGFGEFGGFSMGNDNKTDDIKSINDRTGKNQEIRGTDEDYGKTSSKQKKQKEEDQEADDITGEKKKKDTDGLESKDDKDKEKSDSDGLEKSSGDKEKKDGESSDDKKEKDKKDDDDGVDKDKDDDKDSGGGLKIGKKLWKKYKWYIIIIGGMLAAFVVAFIVIAVMAAIDNLTLGLVSFFGLPEATKEETGEMPGLVDDEKYQYDANGNPMNRTDLINYLENNKSCEGNFWTGIADGWNSLWGHKITETCELIRYIEKETKKNNVDQALIFSTIFYGYDTRPTVDQYINPNEAPNLAPTTEHYSSLSEVLQDKNTHITRKGIDDLIKHSHAVTKSYYYEWVVDVTKDENDKVTSITGKCEYKESESDKYNLDKWKVFMRFGADAADKFDEVVLKYKNFETSSDECKNADDAYTEEVLNQQLKAIASSYGSNVTYKLDMGSVNKARKALETPDATSSEIFYQAADLNSKTKDYFTGYGGVAFDYRNGYAYQNFPSFGPSMDSGGVYYGKVNITYDDVFTPKVVEQLIQDIVGRKTNMNHSLNRDDPDERDDYDSTLGGYTGVPTGANCQQYLTANLNEITVELTDCLGSPMLKTTFADYIMGVTYGEIGAQRNNDNYVLSQMVAAISYALRRNNNYTKGSTIKMRSGNCDQVYCGILRGCYSLNTPLPTLQGCHSYYPGRGTYKGVNESLYPIYQALYEKASDYLIIDGSAPFSAHYVDTYQHRWEDKANQGMSFTQIMQEEYGDEGATLIRCSDGDSTPADPETPEDEDRTGNKPTSEYPNVAPDRGNFYGFSYKDGSDATHITINPDWKTANLVTISPTCEGNSEFASKQYTVHKNAVKNFEKAFKSVCKMLTNGVKITNGQTCKYTMNDIMDGTVFIEKKTASGTFDSHAYGIAQDINYSKRITVNGKEYSPYNTRELSEYLEFVNALGGSEENCKNVNYILWAYAYKDAGFNWGGNYGRNGNSGTYDGKLFELKY